MAPASNGNDVNDCSSERRQVAWRRGTQVQRPYPPTAGKMRHAEAKKHQAGLAFRLHPLGRNWSCQAAVFLDRKSLQLPLHLGSGNFRNSRFRNVSLTRLLSARRETINAGLE